MRTILLIFSLIIFLGCNKNDDSIDDSSVNFESTEITPIEIGKDALYGVGEEGIPQSNLVITNGNDWQTLMNQMNTVNEVTEGFSETDIDFDTYMVLAVFLEVKNTGWKVEMNSVMENETEVDVAIQELEFENAVMCQPFHIVKIPVTDKEIVFE